MKLPSSSRWKIGYTPEFRGWYASISARDAERITAALRQLAQEGPALKRPGIGSIRGSRHPNMKEVRSFGGNLRALVAFDPKRQAIVLLGGDKTNDWDRWYKRNIPVADKLYDRHLQTLGKEGRWPKNRRPPGRDEPGMER